MFDGYRMGGGGNQRVNVFEKGFFFNETKT